MTKAATAKSNAGRKSAYKDEYAAQAHGAAKGGIVTDAGLADVFGVASSTICEWRKAHPEFAQAIEDGKDAATIQRALYKRAKGFSYTETTSIPVEQKDGTIQLVVAKKQTKTVAPDTTAALACLAVVDPARWSKNGSPLMGTINVITGVERG